MGVAIQRRRGTTLETASFTGKLGEVTIDTTKFVVVVHDGSTAGGFPAALENHVHADATDSTDGFMSAADKTKLDAISGSLGNYQTVQLGGIAQPQEAILNLSSDFATTDDFAGTRTTVNLSTIPALGAGTYTKLTVNTKGRVTLGALLTAGDIPLIPASTISNFISTVTSVSLDQMTPPAANINMGTYSIVNLANPINPQDAATKQYVDTAAIGLTFKAACRAASTTNINIAAPGTSMDTVSLNIGDRVLLKNQGDTTQNGIYVFNGPSAVLTRSSDANTSGEVKEGMFVLISEGLVNADTGFVLSTTGTITLGTTSLNFVAFSSGSGAPIAGNGINVTGSTVSVKTVSSSRIAVGSSGVDLATIGGLTPGTYQQFTVDAYGRITATTGATWQSADTGLTNFTILGNASPNGIVAKSAVDTYAVRALQPGGSPATVTITNADGVAGNPIITVNPNTTVQQVIVSQSGSTIGTRQQVNFIPGSGVTLTTADNPSNNRVDVTIASSGGGGGAPNTSEYVTLATDVDLSNSRVLVVGTGLNMVDGGSGNNVTLSLVTDLGTVP